MTIKEIAEAIGRSVNTVSHHIRGGKIPDKYIHRRGRYVTVDKDAISYFERLKKVNAHIPFKPSIFVYIPDPDEQGLGLMLPIESVQRYLAVKAEMRAKGRTKSHYIALTRPRKNNNERQTK